MFESMQLFVGFAVEDFVEFRILNVYLGRADAYNWTLNHHYQGFPNFTLRTHRISHATAGIRTETAHRLL